MMEKEWCTGNDLINLWSVSNHDIAGFMRQGLLKPYRRLGNKAAIDIQYGLSGRNKPLGQIESDVLNNIVILKTEEAPVILDGEINYGVVRRLTKGIISDEEIRQVSGMSSSYRIPTEQEIQDLSKLLYKAQPDGYYLPVPPIKIMGSYSFFLGSEKLSDVAGSLFFQRKDVNRFAAENCFPLLWPDDEEQPIADEPKKQTLPTDMKPSLSAENYFRHEGGGWSIGFQGEQSVFKDYKYIRYILMILEGHGKGIKCSELFRAADDNAFHIGIMSSGQSLDEGLSQDSSWKDQEVSRNKLKEIEQIRSELDKESDPVVKIELEERLRKMENSLKKMNALVDKTGKPIRQPKKMPIDDPLRKKAQRAVKTALDDAYIAFRKAGLEKLANHLEKYMKSDGSYGFRYSDSETHWDLKL